ncbi:SDR family oxidoreductase [Devosia naphthalenivorans]|uniref:SDR family oxidoreductase n=1 Tax=Devosia naphthalenivorans TaxID=2082392 RepID=UPI000D3CF3AB|nr:SDR family oxidoreductase [Devosia naphthalenivorans]
MDRHTVVITGASSGNGRATAHEFARHGAHLVLVARRRNALDEVVRECETLGGVAVAVPADVADASVVAMIAQQALAKFGRIDIWVNCAAVLQFGRVEEVPPAVLERVIMTNVVGYLYGSQAAIRQFRRQGSGILINVSSVLGLAAEAYSSAYSASKFAIRGLTDSIRQEVHDAPDIHVCTVFPFAIDTPIYQHAANFTGHKVTPIHPRYSAEIVAKAIVKLARRPRPETFAGGLAALVPWPAAIAPVLTTRIIRRAALIMQIHKDKAAASAGNVFEPIHDDLKVSGGWQHTASAGGDRLLLVLAGAALSVAAITLLRRRR